MTEAALDMDHRWGERWPLQLHVRLLDTMHSSEEGVLTDLSISGAYVRTAWAATPLARVLLMPVRVSGGLSRFRPLLAYIVRVDAGGIGLEFASDLPTPLISKLSQAQRT